MRRPHSLVKERAFPHIPKSTKTLEPGDFWAIPLEDGRFACGRVISFEHASGKQDLRLFLAGLLDWISDSPPTFESIAGAQTIIQGRAHLRTILATGGSILDNRPLELDGIQPGLFLCSSGGPHRRVLRGFDLDRAATPADIRELPVLVTFGFMSMRQHANSKLCRNASR